MFGEFSGFLVIFIPTCFLILVGTLHIMSFMHKEKKGGSRHRSHRK